MSRASLSEPVITIEAALGVIEAVRSHAAAAGLVVAAAIVDRAGIAVASARMDGASVMALELASAKAWTAAALASPSDALTESAKPSGENWGFATSLNGRLCLLPGGVPVIEAGEMIGAVGVSGGSVDEDRACAEAGAAAVGAAV